MWIRNAKLYLAALAFADSADLRTPLTTISQFIQAEYDGVVLSKDDTPNWSPEKVRSTLGKDFFAASSLVPGAMTAESYGVLTLDVPASVPSGSLTFNALVNDEVHFGLHSAASDKGAASVAPKFTVVLQWRAAALTTDTKFGFGMTTLEGFDIGWGLKGVWLTSNGNVALDAGLAIGSFLPELVPGDVVDWFIEANSATINVYVAVNERPYGQVATLRIAEDAAAPLSPDDRQLQLVLSMMKLRPVIRFDNEGRQSSVVFCDYPLTKSPLPPAAGTVSTPSFRVRDPPAVNPQAAYLGTFQVTSPIASGTTMNIFVHGNSTYVAARVVNNMQVRATISPAAAANQVDVRAQGPVISTMMGAPPAQAELEASLATFLTDLTRVTWSADAASLTLYPANAAGSIPSLELTRYDPHTASKPVELAAPNPFGLRG